MPYITKEAVTQKRKQLKAALPQYKLSVTNSDYAGIQVAIMSGPNDLGEGYLQLNQHCPDYYNEHVAALIGTIQPILDEGRGEGHEDGDYGTVPEYYTWIHVGKWDKPYEIKSI
jgi:hypothetical protein